MGVIQLRLAGFMSCIFFFFFCSLAHGCLLHMTHCDCVKASQSIFTVAWLHFTWLLEIFFLVWIIKSEQTCTKAEKTLLWMYKQQKCHICILAKPPIDSLMAKLDIFFLMNTVFFLHRMAEIDSMTHSYFPKLRSALDSPSWFLL